MKKIIGIFIFTQLGVLNVFAAPGMGACRQVRQACLSAGFVKGAAKEGKGLWLDCVDPVMQGVAKVNKAGIPLPVVDPSVIAACKQEHPKFGSGKVGTKEAH